MAHHFHEPVAVPIKRWNNRVLEFVVEGRSVVLAAGWVPDRGLKVADGPSGNTFDISLNRPIRRERSGLVRR
jgi:hypothetical protein